MSSLSREEVTNVYHWTDNLFSFQTTRNSGFRFQCGQFAMIGLEVSGRPLLRAYSMASASHEDHQLSKVAAVERQVADRFAFDDPADLGIGGLQHGRSRVYRDLG